jgi:ABC-2 type transport system permease protein
MAMESVDEFVTQVAAVADVDVRKLCHDPMELFTRAVQPVLWLLLFGEVMAHVRGLGGDRVGYLDFLAPGILAQSVLFSAIFYGIAAIWERDLGILQRYLVSPAPRVTIVMGKALSSTVRSLAQAVVVYLVALAVGSDLSFAPVHLAGVVLLIAIGSGLFSTFSLIIACIVRTRERFMGIGQVLTMPIFFASNAIYPIDLMPHWLQIVSRLNPLTYEVDALRALMLRGGDPVLGFAVDFAVLLVALAAAIMVAARMLRRMAA